MANDLALKESDLSPRELAVQFTDMEKYFVSEASVYRILKSYDLITSPAYVVLDARSANDRTAPANLISIGPTPKILRWWRLKVTSTLPFHTNAVRWFTFSMSPCDAIRMFFISKRMLSRILSPYRQVRCASLTRLVIEPCVVSGRVSGLEDELKITSSIPLYL